MIGTRLRQNLKSYYPDMKIALIGSRGIPARYGGFETFVQKLSGILAEAGHDVSVWGEKGNAAGESMMGSVSIMESNYRKSKNPLLFYWDSLRRTSGRYDVIFVCGVGASLFYPLLKRKNTILITNVDGLEHLRSKFSFLKKIFVKVSQRFTKRYSDIVISDSAGVTHYWAEELGCSAEKLKTIAYGAEPVLPFLQSILDEYSLEKNSYYLIVARLVPENHILEMIQGFIHSGTEKRLVVVGGLQDSAYLDDLKKIKDPRILFTGSIYIKQVLDSLRGGAYAYLHGHSVGGTNPSLLEAMAASCLCICHDNIFNHEVNSKEQLYFRNAKDLSLRIAEVENMPDAIRKKMQQGSLDRLQSNYSWAKIGQQYIQLLHELNERRHSVQT
jgi:glycosyltransferase involved in cell wall biosynthesis